MTSSLKIHLKPNERIVINGGIVKVDRRVAIELMNDVVFLLEGHILQAEQATTPLKQLYLIAQSMLTDPAGKVVAHEQYVWLHDQLINAIKDQDILEGLVSAKTAIEQERPFDALKKLRTLFALESAQHVIDA